MAVSLTSKQFLQEERWHLYPSMHQMFLTEFFIHLSSIHEFSLILGADMNAAVNLTLDRSCCLNEPSQDASSASLNKLITNLSLAINHSVTYYSFYSNRHTLKLIIYSPLPH